MSPHYPKLQANPHEVFGWILAEDVRIQLSDGRQLFISKGYCFDGHTVPRILWSFLPPHGTDIYASLLHDYLFDLKEHGFTLFTRSFADKEYLRLCLNPHYRSGLIRPYVLYLGLFLFSWIWWYT